MTGVTMMKNTSLITALLAGTFALSAGAAIAGEHACAKVVAQECEKAGMSVANVDRVVYAPNTDGNNNNRGSYAYIHPKGENGFLIVDIDGNCRVRQVFTRGGYSLPGVASY
jgi:hypothetical protein